MNAARTILICAGEASGDLHGANLVQAMRQNNPHLVFYGMGGDRLAAAGVELYAHASDMAVVGLTEVFAKLGTILRVLSRLKASLKTRRPDLVILIDYPDFNFSLARAAKKRGVKVFYYISPQVWAWRKGRIKTIRRVVDRMAVILPFEEDLYRQAQVDATFVGHPLLDSIQTRYDRREALAHFGLQEGKTTIALLPGSRKSEVDRLLPVMAETARRIASLLPRVQFVLPLAETLKKGDVEAILSHHDIVIEVLTGATSDVIAVSDLAIVTSGTATLETALLETPLIVVYKMSPLSYLLGRLFVDVDQIGLVNIIGGKTIAPEFIQGAATPERLTEAAMALLTDKKRYQAVKQDLAAIKHKLGERGAAARTAALALEML